MVPRPAPDIGTSWSSPTSESEDVLLLLLLMLLRLLQLLHGEGEGHWPDDVQASALTPSSVLIAGLSAPRLGHWGFWSGSTSTDPLAPSPRGASGRPPPCPSLAASPVSPSPSRCGPSMTEGRLGDGRGRGRRWSKVFTVEFCVNSERLYYVDVGQEARPDFHLAALISVKGSPRDTDGGESRSGRVRSETDACLQRNAHRLW